ncbi:MAG: hypothetical protein I8H71_01330 [Xanthomonadaceae bacterium]|nr:hypothetical protein [Xanthomonadaceae bacterium]
MLKFLAAVSSALALAGCATPYGPSGMAGGYSETRRADDIYIVRYQGNGFTKPEQAEEMVFLRAAELTVEKGYRFFSILGESGSTDTATVAMPSQTYTTGTVNQWGGFQSRTTSTGGMPMTIRRPSARLHIGLSNVKFSDARTFYDAAEVVQDLGAKYKK